MNGTELRWAVGPSPGKIGLAARPRGGELQALERGFRNCLRKGGSS